MKILKRDLTDLVGWIVLAFPFVAILVVGLWKGFFLLALLAVCFGWFVAFVIAMLIKRFDRKDW